MPIPRRVVDSSHLAEVGHDGVGLVVKFRNGGVWRYPGLAEAMVDRLCRASSPGREFWRLVRGGDGERIG